MNHGYIFRFVGNLSLSWSISTNKGKSVSELKALKKLDYISSIVRAAGTMDDFIHGCQAQGAL
jgi:hypothetical protein